MFLAPCTKHSDTLLVPGVESMFVGGLSFTSNIVACLLLRSVVIAVACCCGIAIPCAKVVDKVADKVAPPKLRTKLLHSCC